VSVTVDGKSLWRCQQGFELNIIYAVQSVTNLGDNWTTLGKVTGARTNLAFTNGNSAARQYYRIEVP
jgi:hypothetical protein